ncbi:IclR family transcriptional regulator [Micrococcaceae sp. AOP34-BR2-30]
MTIGDATNPLTPASGRNESLHRAFDLLKILATSAEGLTVAQLSEESRLPRSTVSRLLASLYDIGVAARPGAQRLWTLGPALDDLTNTPRSQSVLQAVGHDVLVGLSEELQETTMHAVPVSDAAAYVIDEVRGPHLLGISQSWDKRAVTSLSSGFVRLILADLPEVRRERIYESSSLPQPQIARLRSEVDKVADQGYSTIVDELEVGVSGAGVPIYHQKRLVSMLAVHAPTARFTEAFSSTAITALLAAAERIAHLSA